MEIEVSQAGGASAPIQIIKDGVATSVEKDSSVAANTVPIPVEIVSAAGQEISINVANGNIDLQSSHTGANYDSMRIGDGTDLLAVRADGSLDVHVGSSALPTGAATETTLATLATQATLAAMSAKLPASLGQKASAASISIVAANDQPIQTVNIQSAYTGPAGTRSSLGEIIGTQDSKEYSQLTFEIYGTFVATTRIKLSIDNNNYYYAKIYGVDGTGPFDSISAPGLYYVMLDGRLYIPEITAYTSGTVGFKSFASSIPRAAPPLGRTGKTAVNKARNDYSSVNVTTGAYVTLLASTSAAISELEIFDSSGQTLLLATGAAASEVDQVYIIPGGNGRIPLSIAASTRVSIKAVSATANLGEITVNFYGV